MNGKASQLLRRMCLSKFSAILLSVCSTDETNNDCDFQTEGPCTDGSSKFQEEYLKNSSSYVFAHSCLGKSSCFTASRDGHVAISASLALEKI